MRFTNFELVSDISLSALGQLWDFHNCCNFSGLELVPESASVRLRWDMLDSARPLNPAKWCAIRFDGIAEVRVTPTVPGSHPRNARTLSWLGAVAPPDADGRGRLRFHFMDGFDIEVAASEATLESDLGTQGAHG